MPTEADRPEPRINPRPGVVKTLGICNVVFSVLSGISVFISMVWWFTARTSGAMTAQPKVVARSAPSNTTVVAINPFWGMDEPRMAHFSLVQNGIVLVTSSLMFATGIGLLNLRRWAARWWVYLAWLKIVLVVILGGYFIVAVAPALSESMARNFLAAIPPSGRGRAPTMAELLTIYSIMLLIAAVVAILVSSIYPAISLWLLGRPSVKAALIDNTPVQEPELP